MDARLNKYQYREARKNALLMREWEPMVDHVSADRLAKYLFDVATVRMGSSYESTECRAAGRIAEAMVTLRPTFEIH